MKNYRFEMGPITRVAVAAGIGALVGAVVADDSNVPMPFGSQVLVVPDAYRVAKVPGGTALGMAMVHDVLHERYLRHGASWYRKRNVEAENHCHG